MKLLLCVLILAIAGCSSTKVMKDCEQINDGPYFMCQSQSEVK